MICTNIFEIIDFLGASLIINNEGIIRNVNAQATETLNIDEHQPSTLDELFLSQSDHSIFEQLKSENEIEVRLKKDPKTNFNLALFEYEGQLLVAAKPQVNWRMLEQEKQNAKKELDQFVYSISHDLTAPIRGISTLAKWLTNDIADQIEEEQVNTLKLLNERTLHLNNLIQALLKLSRLGRMGYDPVLMNFQTIIEETAHKIKVEYPNVTLQVPTEEIALTFDKNLAFELVENILRNAVEHNKDKDIKLNISYWQKNHCHLISFADNGKGIPARILPKVFNLFHKNTLEKGKLGMGLTICKKIVMIASGEIWIESHENLGTVVYVSLPI